MFLAETLNNIWTWLSPLTRRDRTIYKKPRNIQVCKKMGANLSETFFFYSPINIPIVIKSINLQQEKKQYTGQRDLVLFQYLNTYISVQYSKLICLLWEWYLGTYLLDHLIICKCVNSFAAYTNSMWRYKKTINTVLFKCLHCEYSISETMVTQAIITVTITTER